MLEISAVAPPRYPKTRRITDRNLSSTELESGNAIGAFLQTPAPVLDKIAGPMGARFLSSTGLGSSNLIGRAQFPPVPALDKNQSPRGFTDHLRIWLVNPPGAHGPQSSDVPLRTEKFNGARGLVDSMRKRFGMTQRGHCFSGKA